MADLKNAETTADIMQNYKPLILEYQELRERLKEAEEILRFYTKSCPFRRVPKGSGYIEEEDMGFTARAYFEKYFK